MKDFFKWMFLFFLPAFIAVIFDLLGDPEMGQVIVVFMIPYWGYIIYRLMKYYKKFEDYNNKKI